MAVLKILEIHSFLGYEQDLASNRKSYAKTQAKGLTAQHTAQENPKITRSDMVHVYSFTSFTCSWPPTHATSGAM